MLLDVCHPTGNVFAVSRDNSTHPDDSPAHAFGHPRAVAIRWVVPPDCHGKTAPALLAHKVRRLGLERAASVVRAGDLRRMHADGLARVLTVDDVVARGDHVELWRIAPDDADAPFPQPRLLFDGPSAHGGSLVVVDKPGDLAVHPSARYLHHTLTAWLAKHAATTGGVRTNPCHRLDRETSGVLVCASGAAERRWKTAFQEGRVAKEYLAVVRGVVDKPFTVEAPLALQGDRGLVRIRMIVDAAGQSAVTDVAPVRVARERSLVRCVPRTGRQHQLRAHLAHAGFPIVGDKIYAMGDAWFDAFTRFALTDAQRSELEHPRQALHCARVALDDEAFDAPLPDELAALV
jgi:23S rRNA pseudouridine1911/1915/1917 synthase